MQNADLVTASSEAWNAIAPEIEQLFAQQWAEPKLPCMEYRSCTGFQLDSPGRAPPRESPNSTPFPSALLAQVCMSPHTCVVVIGTA